MIQMKNRLFLSKEIYSYYYIEQTRTVYEKLADISVNEDENYWICEFCDCKYEIERTKKEFENYLIQLWNQGRGM